MEYLEYCWVFYGREALLRRDLELADLSQKLTAQDKQIEELRKAGTQVSTPPQSFESEPTSSGSKDKETGIHADNLQNDIRIHSLQVTIIRFTVSYCA